MVFFWPCYGFAMVVLSICYGFAMVGFLAVFGIVHIIMHEIKKQNCMRSKSAGKLILEPG